MKLTYNAHFLIVEHSSLEEIELCPNYLLVQRNALL